MKYILPTFFLLTTSYPVYSDNFTNMTINSVYVRTIPTPSIFIYTNPTISTSCANPDGSILITNATAPNEYEKMLTSLALTLHSTDKTAEIDIDCANKKVKRILTQK